VHFQGITGPAVWAYGLVYTTGTTGSITAVVQRKLNSTYVVSGTDTTEQSVIADYEATLGTAVASLYKPVLAVGAGYLAAATVSSVTSGSTTTNAISLSVWAAGTTTPTTTTIASGTDTASTATQDYAVNSVWYEDGYFYVSYSSVVGSVASGSSINQWIETVYLQGLGAPNASKLYTTPMSTGATYTATPTPAWTRGTSVSYLLAKAGPSNYTLSSYIQVVYKVPATSSAKTYVVLVNRTSGAPGTAVTIATDVAAGTSAAGFTFVPAGVFFSIYAYGALVSNQTQATSAATTYSYTLTVAFNDSTTTIADSGLTFSGAATAASTPLVAMGYPYNSTGYVIIAQYSTGTTNQIGFSSNTYNSSGAAATSTLGPAAIGTLTGSANFFIDPTNLGLWVGYDIYDSASGTPLAVYSGYIARVVYSLFPTTTFGNVLTSFFAFLTLLLASLFAF
jgi:hypothetical protein